MNLKRPEKYPDYIILKSSRTSVRPCYDYDPMVDLLMKPTDVCAYKSRHHEALALI